MPQAEGKVEISFDDPGKTISLRLRGSIEQSAACFEKKHPGRVLKLVIMPIQESDCINFKYDEGLGLQDENMFNIHPTEFGLVSKGARYIESGINSKALSPW